MDALRYQRLVIGYHGCEEAVRDQVLAGGSGLKPSENDYDWLGRGIYFWEHGPERAMEWAVAQKSRRRIRHPAVVGALIQLGECFDLLDTKYTEVLSDAYSVFEETIRISGRQVPENSAAHSEDPDFLLRRRDCAVVNWVVDQYEASSTGAFHTVRGLFQEGKPAFPDSCIMKKSHIQVAVRDPSCILGYFLPA